MTSEVGDPPLLTKSCPPVSYRIPKLQLNGISNSLPSSFSTKAVKTANATSLDCSDSHSIDSPLSGISDCPPNVHHDDNKLAEVSSFECKSEPEVVGTEDVVLLELIKDGQTPTIVSCRSPCPRCETYKEKLEAIEKEERRLKDLEARILLKRAQLTNSAALNCDLLNKEVQTVEANLDTPRMMETDVVSSSGLINLSMTTEECSTQTPRSSTVTRSTQTLRKLVGWQSSSNIQLRKSQLNRGAAKSEMNEQKSNLINLTDTNEKRPVVPKIPPQRSSSAGCSKRSTVHEISQLRSSSVRPSRALQLSSSVGSATSPVNTTHQPAPPSGKSNSNNHSKAPPPAVARLVGVCQRSTNRTLVKPSPRAGSRGGNSSSKENPSSANNVVKGYLHPDSVLASHTKKAPVMVANAIAAVIMGLGSPPQPATTSTPSLDENQNQSGTASAEKANEHPKKGG